MSVGYNNRYMKGFTLIELLIVIVIIAILASALTIGITSFICTGKETATRTLMQNVGFALAKYKQDKNKFPDTIAVTFSSKNLVTELENANLMGFKEDEKNANGEIVSKVFPDKTVKYRNNNQKPYNADNYSPQDPNTEPPRKNKNMVDMWTSGCSEGDKEGWVVNNW